MTGGRHEQEEDEMSFTQIIEVRADSADALEEHVGKYHAAEKDRAPGYRRARVLEDSDRPGTYLIEVEFNSAEEAKRNSARPVTDEWARKLTSLINGEPSFRNLNELCSTES
jgi:quinol monooxygenase YgiN